jgi:hypothetical protein
MLVYATSLTNWDGGWTVGPRYATVIVPFVIFGAGLGWEASRPSIRRVLLPLGAGLGIASVFFTTLTSVLFPHLPPEHVNPVFEIILPLWRDAFTPHSLGRWLFGLEGRAAQAPFLAVLGAIVVYLAWVASGRFLPSRASVARALGSSAAALVVVAIVLYQGSLPRTKPQRVVDAGTAWIRKTIWEPPAPRAKAP